MRFGAEKVLAVALSLTSINEAGAQTRYNPQHPMEDAGVETCLPEGRATISRGEYRGHTLNARRILAAIYGHSVLVAGRQREGQPTRDVTDNLITAASGCTEEDFDAAERFLETRNRASSERRLFEDALHALRSEVADARAD